MNSLDDKDVSLNKPIKMWKNIPIDCRLETDSLNELDDFITYPYIGMIFYSKEEDDYYKVLSLAPGYRVSRTGEIVRNDTGGPEIPGYFVGKYEQYKLKGNTKTMIKKAYIKDGDLYIVFYDDQEIRVGHVTGEDGYSPQVSKIEDFSDPLNYISKIKVTYLDRITEKEVNVITKNLVGPYVINVEDLIDPETNKNTGYIKFTLNNNETYTVGPYGVESFEINNNGHLIEKCYDGTEIDLGSVKGEDGEKGADGREIELRTYPVPDLEHPDVKPTRIEWRYRTLDPSAGWNTLIELDYIKGEDGYSPIVTVTDIAGGHKVDITDKIHQQIPHSFNVMDGEDGKEVVLSKYPLTGIPTEVRWKYIDEPDSAYRFLISLDTITGPQGPQGTVGPQGPQGLQGETGLDGAKGEDGEDGYSPVVTITDITRGHRVDITDEEHQQIPHSFNVMDGREIILRVSPDGTKIQWQYNGDQNWIDLMAVSTITGSSFNLGTVTTTTKDPNTEAEVIVTPRQNDPETYDFIFRIPRGKNFNKGTITTITGNPGTDADVSITARQNDPETYDFTFTIPRGAQGLPGTDGEDGLQIMLSTDQNPTDNNNTWVVWRYDDGSSAPYSDWNYLFAITGSHGIAPSAYVEKSGGISTLYVNDLIHGNTTVNILDGADGQDGNDGEDGFTPTITATKVNKTTTIIITNKDTQPTTVTILDGEDGTNGADGREIQISKQTSYIPIGGSEVLSNQPVAICWRYKTLNDSDPWKEVTQLTTIKGDPGDDGREIALARDQHFYPTPEAQETIDALVWHYTSTPSGTEDPWKLLLNLADIQGHDGKSFNLGDVTTSESQDGSAHVTIIEQEDQETHEGTGFYDFDFEIPKGGKFEFVTELPELADAQTDTIYFLLTPSYERGLNIGLLDIPNDQHDPVRSYPDKNCYEPWVVQTAEVGGVLSKIKWELVSPQQYRISASMVDYLWKVNDTYTVFDDWDTAPEIPPYQKQFGDITPLKDFVYRIGPNNTLILVKYIGQGDVYLNISPYYRILQQDGSYITYTVTELDGTYYSDKIYYQVADEDSLPTEYQWNTSTFHTDDNGVEDTQTVFTGPNVYSLYIADTVTKLTRVLIKTSNIPIYHIPASVTVIGDYAFYNSSNQTMVFEELDAGGETAHYVGFDESNIEAIGTYGCGETTNLRMLKKDPSTGEYHSSIDLVTPPSLKKISNYGFYHAGQVAHIDTSKSTNLYIGEGGFQRANLSAQQTLSSSTYYTDASFKGFDTLKHDYNNGQPAIGPAAASIYFLDAEHIGNNYNSDPNHANDKLFVSLNSNDPVFVADVPPND